MLKKSLVPTPLRTARAPVAIAPVAARSRFRTLEILAALARWGTALLVARVRGVRDPAWKARRLRAMLESLGGLWIKVGQLLSLRVDLFDAATCRELAALQYQAVGFPAPVARAIVERELGVPVDAVFDVFDDVPAAAASVAQIHRARLRGRNDGWVAVKVQRPEIDATFAADMTFIRRIIALVERLPVVPPFRWSDFVLELEQTLLEEVDYRYEAQNLRQMKKSLRAHRIHVPKVFRRYSTRRVLVMEWIEGVLLSDFMRMHDADRETLDAWLLENDIDPRRIGRRLYFSCQRQVLEDNLFHSDLHPGNIALLRHNHIALIDFGSVGSLERQNHAKYYLFLEAIGHGEYARAVDYLFLLNHALPNIDTAELKADLVRTIKTWERRTITKSLPYKERSQASLAAEMGRVMFQHRMTPEWFFLKATRASTTLDTALGYLIPNASFSDLLARYFHGARRRRLRAAFRRENLYRTADAVLRAGGVLELAAEARISGGEVLRRSAQVFEPASLPSRDLLAYLFGTAVVVSAAAAVALLVLWLMPPSPLPDAARPLALLSTAQRWLVMGAVAWIFSTCVKFRRRFLRVEYDHDRRRRP